MELSPTVSVRAAATIGATLVAASISGCTGVLEVVFDGRQEIDPPPEYFAWYWATERCSGLEGDIRRVRWFLAVSIVTNGILAVANWSPPHDITLRRDMQRDGFVVSHEILHDLLDGDPGHGNPAWDACRLREVVD